MQNLILSILDISLSVHEAVRNEKLPIHVGDTASSMFGIDFLLLFYMGRDSCKNILK